MGEIVAVMQRQAELELSADTADEFCRISAATSDRLVAPVRQCLAIKGRRPGILRDRPGGPRRRRHAARVLPNSHTHLRRHGMDRARAVRNKDQTWVFAALTDIEAGLPFPLRGLDSDMAASSSTTISSATARPMRSRSRGPGPTANGNCFVEQKNWSIARQAVGYLRYHTQAELEVLGELYGRLRL
jgi:hypothetical protein